MRTFFFVAMALCLDAAFAGGRMDPGNDSLNLLEGDYTITEFRFTNGKFILVPASQQTIGHQTLGKAMVYREYVAEFLKRLP